MKVLLTHERFPPDFAGGGEVVLERLATELAARSIDIRVLCAGDPSLTHHNNTPTKRLPISRFRLNTAVRAITEHARDADIIQTFTYHAALPSLIAARRLNKPVFMMVLGLFGPMWRRMKGPLRGRAFEWWERMLIQRSFTNTIFLSDFSHDLGLRLGADPHRSVVIPPGIDPQRFNPHAPKNNSVLFVGRLDVRKGIDDVLAVAAALPRVPFRIIGYEGEDESIRRDAPPNITFTHARGSALRDEYARASIFFLPSRAETFGLVIAEAMASACAVVSTIDIGFKGALVRPGDRPAMIDSIRRYIEDPAEARRL
ncbi:MAG: glycosyltransferase family 4 protein, partial [Planctomycetota bacterium]|nr:glycosyltransferase family 4 protein [Planctomycetota bacterium]